MGFLMVKEKRSLLLTYYLRTTIRNCKDWLFPLRNVDRAIGVFDNARSDFERLIRPNAGFVFKLSMDDTPSSEIPK
jgi:hypothetical protein